MNQLLSKLVALPFQRVLMISILLAGLYSYFYTYDSYSRLNAQVQTLAQEIANQTNVRKDTEETLKKEISVKASVADLAKQFEAITKSLPVQLTPSDVIGYVDTFAKKTNIKDVAQTPLPVTKRDIVEEVPVQVTCVGTYFQIGDFISMVSNFQPMMRVSNYTISGQDGVPDSKQEGKYKFTVKLFAYRSVTEKAEEPTK